MKTPINGETFFPKLLAEWVEAIRGDLGLPEALSIASAPSAKAYALPLLEFSCPSFTLPAHDIIAIYSVNMILVWSADGEPAAGETPEDAEARREAELTLESDAIALLRAAMALQKGQQLGDALEIPSFFDWCDARTVPADEDGWQLQSKQLVGGGGALEFVQEKRLRRRTTTYTLRAQTNEFTI